MTRVAAARMEGSRRTPLLGGKEGGLGPTIDGKGSMRANRLRSVLGGRAASRCFTIAERSTSWRIRVSPGVNSATEAPTQTIPRPIAVPRRRPPAVSISRRGGSLRPPRMNDPANSAANWRSIAPITAPMSPAAGVHFDVDPPWRTCGATREPT